MRLLLTSDLHYGANQKTDQIYRQWLETVPTDVDVVVMAGDLNCNLSKQFRNILRLFRQKFPSTPILVVLGNHDYRNRAVNNGEKQRSLLALLERLREWMAEEQVVYLSEHPNFVIDDYAFFGYDNWYQNYIAEDNHEGYFHSTIDGRLHGLDCGLVEFSTFFQKRCEKQLENLLPELKQSTKKNVFISHFPLLTGLIDSECGNVSDWSTLSPYLKYYFFGHIHKNYDGVKDGVIYASSGFDVNKPRTKIITLE